MTSQATGVRLSGYSSVDELRKPCVLVVDDQEGVLTFIRIDLKMRGFDVITCTSGEEALEQIESARPDIMILDIVMPGMDGFEVLEKLRPHSKIPVIAFSSSPGNQERARKLGADDFIFKPFNPDEMAARIRQLLG